MYKTNKGEEGTQDRRGPAEDKRITKCGPTGIKKKQKKTTNQV